MNEILIEWWHGLNKWWKRKWTNEMDGWMDKEMNEWNIEWMDDDDWINGLMMNEWNE